MYTDETMEGVLGVDKNIRRQSAASSGIAA